LVVSVSVEIGIYVYKLPLSESAPQMRETNTEILAKHHGEKEMVGQR
jgi:hypothetical protein